MDGASDDAGDDYVDVDKIVPDQTPARASSVTLSGTPTSATPASRLGSSRVHPKPQQAKPKTRQQTIDEENRFAKLQALEMVAGDMSPPPTRKAASSMPNYSACNRTFSIATTYNIDSDGEDGIEEVPARGAIRA